MKEELSVEVKEKEKLEKPKETVVVIEEEANLFDAITIRLAGPETIRAWSRGEIKKPETIDYRTLKPEKTVASANVFLDRRGTGNATAGSTVGSNTRGSSVTVAGLR